MILRIAAGLALVIGLGGFGGFLTLIGKSPFASLETRHLRDMKDRAGEPRAYQPMTALDFAALPRSAPIAEYSGIERRGVVMEGYVQNMLRGPDGDFHIELVEAIPATERGTYVTGEITPAFRAGSRAWTYEGLAWAFRPWRGNAMAVWHAPPRRVRVSGWLLNDWPHAGPVFREQGVEPRVSAWEIHPVTKVELWNERDETWEPFAR